MILPTYGAVEDLILAAASLVGAYLLLGVAVDLVRSWFRGGPRP